MGAEIMVLSAGCFVAAFCAGMAGFAFVLVAAGILLHVFPPATLAPVLVLGSLFVQSLALPAVWAEIDWRRMRLLVAAATLGIGPGLLKADQAFSQRRTGRLDDETGDLVFDASQGLSLRAAPPRDGALRLEVATADGKRQFSGLLKALSP